MIISTNSGYVIQNQKTMAIINIYHDLSKAKLACDKLNGVKS